MLASEIVEVVSVSCLAELRARDVQTRGHLQGSPKRPNTTLTTKDVGSLALFGGDSSWQDLNGILHSLEG